MMDKQRIGTESEAFALACSGWTTAFIMVRSSVKLSQYLLEQVLY